MDPVLPVSFNCLKDCRHGRMLFNQNDLYVGRSLDLYGEFSEGEVVIYRQVLRPGHIVLDVGANIGAHTLFFARQVGPSGKVFAFEPQRIVFQTLCANMALNSITNAWCLLEAAGSEAGVLIVPSLNYQQSGNFGGIALGSSSAGEPVPVVTIDSLNLPSCQLIKIDVEGMEETVLRGAVNTVARFKPILYVENDRPAKSESLIRYIDSLGYAMYWHLPRLYNPQNFLGNSLNVFGEIVSRNMLCFHRSVARHIEGFQPVQVPGAAGVSQ